MTPTNDEMAAIKDGKATRDISQGELIDIPLEEYQRIKNGYHPECAKKKMSKEPDKEWWYDEGESIANGADAYGVMKRVVAGAERRMVKRVEEVVERMRMGKTIPPAEFTDVDDSIHWAVRVTIENLLIKLEELKNNL